MNDRPAPVELVDEPALAPTGAAWIAPLLLAAWVMWAYVVPAVAPLVPSLVPTL